jgi:electron transfer flavoprotein beta subunit
VADHLQMPSLTQVIKIDVEDGAPALRAPGRVRLRHGARRAARGISVGDAINEPRYPSLKAIMGAKKKPLETKSVSDVGIEADRVGYDNARARCTDFKAPPAKAAGEIIEDEDTNETVEKIVAWLDERKLLA